jgi:hypothetical protein
MTSFLYPLLLNEALILVHNCTGNACLHLKPHFVSQSGIALPFNVIKVVAQCFQVIRVVHRCYDKEYNRSSTEHYRAIEFMARKQIYKRNTKLHPADGRSLNTQEPKADKSFYIRVDTNEVCKAMRPV